MNDVNVNSVEVIGLWLSFPNKTVVIVNALSVRVTEGEYQSTTLSSKRTNSIVREHFLWGLLKEYQQTTRSLYTHTHTHILCDITT